MWRAWINPERLREHMDWYARGKQGEGRIDLEGKDLRGMGIARSFAGARLVRCNMAQVKLVHCTFDEAELIECNLDDAGMSWANFRRARMEGMTFRRANLVLTRFSSSNITGGSFADANAENSTWFSVRAQDVEFRRTRLVMARLEDAVFERCDFRDAQLMRGEPGVDGGSALSAQFIDCDFTGADLTGWEIGVTRFERCKLAGARGKPVIKQAIVLRDNDVPEAKLLAKWR
jgi:uncharacterized protein YjbI with pentapeptide repeats